jgi:hypothetical protein
MIQFNLNRFGKLAKWSLRNDRNYYVKSFLQFFVITTLIFLAFTTHFLNVSNGYAPCAVAMISVFIILPIMGPSMMFYSMKNKYDKQAMLMLPASNFEKYLMRYSTWLILLPIYTVALMGADLIQYLVNIMMNHEYTTFVMSFIVDKLSNANMSDEWVPKAAWHAIIVMALATHSFYALGGTFFRSHKYAWVYTSVAFVVLGMLSIWLTPESGKMENNSQPSTLEYVIWDSISAIWMIFNFWLSYRCFCRTQNIGRFINF